MIQFINSIPTAVIACMIPLFAVVWIAWVILYSTSRRNNPL